MLKSLYRRSRSSLCFFFMVAAPIGGEQRSEPLLLDIPKACAHAIRHNRQVQAAQEAIRRSQLNVDHEAGEFDLHFGPTGQLGFVGGGTAGTGPTVGVGFDMSKKFRSGTKISLSPYVYRANEKYNTTLRGYLSQPLLRGFSYGYNNAKIEAARYALRSACRGCYLQQLKLVQKVIGAMYEIVKQQELLRLAEESLQQIGCYLQAARLKEKVGLGDSTQLYRAEMEQSRGYEKLLTAQEKLQEALDSFSDLLALPLGQPIEIEVPLAYHEIDLEEQEAVELACQHRVELAQAKEQIEEQKRIVRWSCHNMWPELNMVVNYSNWGIDQVFTRSLNCKRESSWGVGFTTSGDLYRGSERLFYDTAQINLEGAYANLEQVESSIALEVKKAWRNVKQTQRRTQLQAEQVVLMEKELQLATVRADCNVASYFELLQAQQTVRTAQASYTNSLLDAIQAEFALVLAVGNLGEGPFQNKEARLR